MNTKYQYLALEYAEALKAYYVLEVHCRTSELHEDMRALRRAYDNMCALQNSLALAAEELALQEF